MILMSSSGIEYPLSWRIRHQADVKPTPRLVFMKTLAWSLLTTSWRWTGTLRMIAYTTLSTVSSRREPTACDAKPSNTKSRLSSKFLLFIEISRKNSLYFRRIYVCSITVWFIQNETKYILLSPEEIVRQNFLDWSEYSNFLNFFITFTDYAWMWWSMLLPYSSFALKHF